MNLVRTEPPFPHRLLQVAIVLVYVATTLSALLSVSRMAAPIRAILMSFSVAGAIFLGETVLQSSDQSSSRAAAKTPEWVGATQPHPALGVVYRPNSVVKSYYPDNPRDYFHAEMREADWGLRVGEGNAATMVFPPSEPDRVRIAITKADSKMGYDVQLNQPRLKVDSMQQYRVSFRARAETPRQISVGFAMAHDPWDNLGLYSNKELTPEWQDFQEDFVARAGDENARIHFDMGGRAIGLEIASVSLRTLPDRKPVEPGLAPRKHLVSYRFNALGCRGPDYSIPRPTGSARILLLGDSYTLGIGVHEEDTFAKQLENLLKSSASGQTYEVINCAVSGYGTQDEVLFYQFFGAKYDPNLVLIVMVADDDLSYLEQIKGGYHNSRAGKLESLFHIWATIQKDRPQRPPADFSDDVEELKRLDSEVRKRGALLGVVIFRNVCEPSDPADSKNAWNQLASTVTKGLKDAKIPILDLGSQPGQMYRGEPLCKKYSHKDLVVHATDLHPNNIAHAFAAREILSFLERKKLLAK